MTLNPFGLGTRSHTSFLVNWFNSSYIARIQSLSKRASSIFVGSIRDTNPMRDSSEFLNVHLVLIGSSFFPRILSSGWAMLLLDNFLWSWSTEGTGILVTFPSNIVGASLLGTYDVLPSAPVNSTSISANDSFCFKFWGSRLSSNLTLVDSSTICIYVFYTLYPLERSEYPNIIHFRALKSNLFRWSLVFRIKHVHPKGWK